MKILAVANQKGGVGKSTVTVHLAYAAQEAGMRVLVVDMDKQGSLSLSFPPSVDAMPGMVASSLYDADVDDEQPEVISDHLSIIRGDAALLAVDKAENEVIRCPAKALRRFADNFDLCLIDTPPLLGVRLMASLTAADFVVTPVSIGLYELEGVSDLMQTIHVIRTQGFNPRLHHIGILPIKTNSRSEDDRESLADLRRQYGSVIMTQELPERAPVRKAIKTRVPVWRHTKGEGHLIAAREWKAACAEILKRVGK